MKKLIFNLVFKKIPKTRVGRCTHCDARSICHKSYYKCTCNMEQQYCWRIIGLNICLKVNLKKLKKLL